MEAVNPATAEFWRKARFQFAPWELGDWAKTKTNVSGKGGAAWAGDPTVTGESATADELQARFEVLPAKGKVGWTGADGDVSVEIAGGGTGRRSLWAFADTLMAEYDAQTHSRIQDTLQMPHSTVALIELTDEGATGQVEYFWKVGADGKLVPFFLPSDEQVANGEMLWPVAGLASRDGRSVLFLTSRVRVDTSTNTNTISLVGTTAIVIPDVVSNEDPRQWQYTRHDVGTSELTWFSAVFFAEPEGDQVYLFGHSGAEQNPNSPTILSRANFADLLQQNWDRREYWAQPGQWSKDPANFRTIGVPSWETTCTWSCELGLWCSFWIPFPDPAGPPPAVYLYTAETVTGEWAMTKILDIPPPFNADPWFSYAAKAHPELQQRSLSDGAAGQASQGAPLQANLVYTYVSNLNTLGMPEQQALEEFSAEFFEPGGMLFPKRGYWPRYMNVMISRPAS
jgi:hypothetical protein